MNWNHYPYVRMLIPFVAGIGLSMQLYTVAGMLVWVPVVLTCMYCGLVIFAYRNISYRRRWIAGPLVVLVLFSAGYILGVQKQPAKIQSPDIPEGPVVVLIELTDEPAERANTYRVFGQLLGIEPTGPGGVEGSGLLVYFEKSGRVDHLQYGDMVRMETRVQAIRNPGNPGEFDLRGYYGRKGIFFQCYVKKDDWKRVGDGGGIPLVSFSKKVRRYLMEVLKAGGLEGPELGVASALLLGYDAYLDREQKRQFSSAGAMHILCVSGLHVGIIALLLNTVLRFMNRGRWLRVCKLLILLTAIWMYAALTGLAPSVMRAATMFSFISIGHSMRRTVSIYNMLAASAFLLLVVDPTMLAEVGFQLSYAAVTAILVLYKPVYNLILPRFKLVDKAWQISAVSICATLGTLPLSLYYFRQFPNLFLVTNLVVIPAAFLIVLLGVVLLAASFLPVLTRIFGMILEILIRGLNGFVAWIDQLPFSTTTGVCINSLEAMLLMLMLVSSAVFLVGRHRKPVFFGLGFAFLFFVSLNIRQVAQLKQQQLVVYNIRGHDALEFVYGNHSVFLGDSLLLRDTVIKRYSTAGFHELFGITHTLEYDIRADSVWTDWFFKQGPVIGFANWAVVLAGPNELDLCRWDRRENLVYFSRNTPSFQPSVEGLEADQLVVGSSVPTWEKDQLLESIDRATGRVHDVAEKGAFVVRLQ